MDEHLELIYDEEEQFFGNIDDMEDYYENEGLEMPKYAYRIYLEPVSLDLDNILENACEEHAEGVMGSLEGVSELREAIKKFNKVNENVGSYRIDYKTIVKLFVD